MSSESSENRNNGQKKDGKTRRRKTGTHFHCYLLRSLDPRHPHKTYVGFTTNPKQRLRQHNGEVKGGARRTSRKGRPWQFVVVVHGFSGDKPALQFEWAWQHPGRSRNVRDAIGDPDAAVLSRKRGVKGALSVLKTLLAECSSLCSAHSLGLFFLEQKWKEMFESIEVESGPPTLMRCDVLSVEEMPFWKDIAKNRKERRRQQSFARKMADSSFDVSESEEMVAACPKESCAICLRLLQASEVPSKCLRCSKSFHDICLEMETGDSDDGTDEERCPFCRVDANNHNEKLGVVVTESFDSSSEQSIFNKDYRRYSDMDDESVSDSEESFDGNSRSVWDRPAKTASKGVDEVSRQTHSSVVVVDLTDTPIRPPTDSHISLSLDVIDLCGSPS